jgi:hypothetical protein
VYNKPHIIFLLETHISGVRADEGSTILGFDGMIRSGANGFAGGIWALSISQMVDASVHHIHSRCLTLEIADLDGHKWLCNCVLLYTQVQFLL